MNRCILIMAWVLCIVAGSRVDAQDRTWGGGTLPEFLAVYDTDTNGVLSVEEIQAMKEARRELREDFLDQWDTDGDGSLSEEEREAARETVRTQIEQTRTNRFDEADLDGNGCLDTNEFNALPAVQELAAKNPEAPAQIYDRLDADTNRCVDVYEFTSRLRHRLWHWRTEEIYQRADADTNGCLTFLEFNTIPQVQKLGTLNTNLPHRLYAHLDADDNRCLSLEEFVRPPQPPPLQWRIEAVYRQADGDTNGCLTLAEFSLIPAVARMAEWHPDYPAKMFAALDMDKNNCLSPSEFLGLVRPPEWRTAETYGAYAGGDDCMTLDEFRNIPVVIEMGRVDPDHPERFYRKLDANHDVCLSLAEFTATFTIWSE